MSKGIVYEMHAEARYTAYRNLGAHVMDCDVCKRALVVEDRCPEGRTFAKRVTDVELKQIEELTEFEVLNAN